MKHSQEDSFRFVRDTVVACVALMIHLRSALENEDMSQVYVAMDAAVLGLKPKHNKNQRQWLEIKTLVERLKDALSRERIHRM